jgi:hypothetical protein
LWGNFSWHQDTLRVETSIGPLTESARTGEARKDNPQIIELSGEIFGLALGKAALPQKPPLLKMHARGIQLLPGVLGKALPHHFTSQVEFDTYFEGNPDSLNIRIAGRHKAAGYTLFQSFSYLRSHKKEQRLVFGDFKLFPGGNNEISATYSAIWQDSFFM